MKYSNLARLSASVFAISLLAACGAGGGDTGAGQDGATQAAGSQAEGEPVYGGTLTVGILGGGASDTLDGHVSVTRPDGARILSLYDRLTTYDTDHQIVMGLAEEVTPSEDATVWTVKLRPGLKFSDGSPITSHDVIYSLRRITNPDDPKVQSEAFSLLQRDDMRAIDELTAEIPFSEPFVLFPDEAAHNSASIVPEGYDPDNPVGSGPFMFESFTPGQESVFVPNPHYWREGEPYVDELKIVNFPDDTSRVNALLGGQVDAIEQLPLSQISIVEANPNLELLESETGAWIPFTMRVDKEPFDDARVRQAFRLIVDRQEMIDQVFDGRGTLGNDLYAPYDACYDDSRPQREQDIEQAKKLLDEAGYADLDIELVTAPGAAGMVEAAQVFAQQAKEAGVNVNVRQVDTGVFYGEDYLNWTFAMDYWQTRDFLPQAAQSGFPTSPFNETHWDNPKWQELVTEANRTVDEEKRCELIQQAQDIEFEEGGFIVWGFRSIVDAHASFVKGFEPDRSGIPLTSNRFRTVWLDH